MILYTLLFQVGKLPNNLRDIINKTNLRGNIMGMFSFLDKPFRTGATQAAKQAKIMGQETLDEQGALRTEIGGIYQPTMDTGSEAFKGIADYYAGNQQPIINQAMASPFMSQLVDTGEQAISRNAQATGGFRSGSTQENLAGNSQNVLMSLVNQVLQGKQGIANAGVGATDAYSTAMQNIQAGQGATRGNIANIDIAKAAGRQNLLGGLVQGAATVGAGLAMAPVAPAAALASDERLKTNIVKVDEKHDLPWYTWDWNKLAESVGLHGSSEGHIAQEVQKVRPDLVVEKNGYLAVKYGGF